MFRKDALFYLCPMSTPALEVLNDPNNAYLLDQFQQRPCFAIGNFRSKSRTREALVTIGRTGDIVLRGTDYSREQCSFAINPGTQVIMFRDDSKRGTSAVHGPDSTPFRPGIPRKVVVQPKLNTLIGSE
jgi:hypothetical protein